MWELDHIESRAPENWCFWIVVLQKSLESHLDSKGVKPVHPKVNQFWIFIGRTDVEPEAPILWPPDVKNWLIGKDPDAGKYWRQEKRMTEDEMVGWHHQLDGHEFEQASGVGDGQGGLVYCSSWGHKELDMTEQLNWAEWRKSNRNSSYLNKYNRLFLSTLKISWSLNYRIVTEISMYTDVIFKITVTWRRGKESCIVLQSFSSTLNGKWLMLITLWKAKYLYCNL